MSIKTKIFWLTVYILAFSVGFLIGDLFLNTANAADFEHFQHNYSNLVTDELSIPFTISCPNREITFNSFSFFGRVSAGTANVTLVLPSNNVVLPVNATYGKKEFALSTPVVCSSGGTVSGSLTSTLPIYHYFFNPPAQATSLSSILTPSNDVLISKHSNGLTTLITAGFTEQYPDIPTTTTESPTTTTEVISFYSDSQTLFFGFLIFFLGLYTVIFIGYRRK